MSARKLMTDVFWDRKEVLMVEFMQQRTIIMSQMHCETLKNCVEPAIQKRKAWNDDIRCSDFP
jgi:hypothetical protein